MAVLSKDQVGPRWIIFIADIFICLLSIVLSYTLRFEFNIPEVEIELMKIALPIYIAVRAISFLIGRTFASYVRYTSIEDSKRIVQVIFLGTIVLFLSNLVRYLFIDGLFVFPTSVLLIDLFQSVLFLMGGRIFIKMAYYDRKGTQLKKKVIIYGAGEMGLVTKRALEQKKGGNKSVVGFIDDDQKKVGMRIEGVKVYSSKNLDKTIAKFNADEVIFSILNPSRSKQQKVVDQCLNTGVAMLHVPPVNDWINGELNVNQIKNLKIEDLLDRTEIKLDPERLRSFLGDKVILVTGAAGSIGSEIARQIALIGCKKLWLLDQAETPLYELEQELLGKGHRNFEAIIADVTQFDRIRYIFNTINPEIIFHAAAYKHVPLMENNPVEAIKVNALATRNLAELAQAGNVEKFVFVSTDKAVNPTNVMGASKRFGELLIKNLGGDCHFISTRFGNVLGSNGSVIPLFKKQIEAGGPVTITHPEITRYFMTIPEACSLVLEAGFMGDKNQTFVFDMGESVKIVDLARNMIRLYGLEPEKDISIIYTGLRPGEKLYEETLADGEVNENTHHPKIQIFKDPTPSSLTIDFDRIENLVSNNDNEGLIKELKRIIPEFKSNNSVYSKLD
ncbi:polysaccharide biosynthesis protein [Luteibaculum oceani]|uniref:Polysaccharide biosynthesis protein n=1 Tax=Luteibaculum oceani TaxID=1294296 RepID=A0A5C6V958_9FLAO|nr:nucleoside-diphosphate sugar epimerase/dehydratase [Luteibaculum oceani]TXC81953.1 polysaccharide biosynthesis protein [Luteibaculum oceani]